MAADALERIKSSINRGIATISVKTSSSLEKSKIKTHIDSLTREIEKDLLLLGSEAYQVWRSEAQDYTALNSRFEAIRYKQEEIDRLTEELSNIDERDNQILGTADRPEETAPKFVCENCGAEYDAPAKFCRKCGNKMAE